MLRKTVCLFTAEISAEAWVWVEIVMASAVVVLRTLEKIL